MPDKPENTIEKDKAEETIFNSDIGDDWGEAFQAEDFMFSPAEDTNSEFFLDDDSFNDESSEGVNETSLLNTDLQVEKKASIPGVNVFLNLLNLLFALPIKYRIPAILLPIVLLISLFSSLKSTPEQQSTQLPQQGENIAAQQNETDIDGSQQLTTEENGTSKNEMQDKVVIQPEKVRKRWQFPSFLLSTVKDERKSTEFLSVDLTLVLLLAEEEPLPSKEELRIREIIYQFFNNHPYEDLKRFSLSRGELNRSLRSWLNKQLPDLPLSSIVFDRYSLL